MTGKKWQIRALLIQALLIQALLFCGCFILLIVASCSHSGGISPERQYKPLAEFRDPLPDGGEGPAMIVLPPGQFLMGVAEDNPFQLASEKPRHQVNIPRAFAISKYEVTFSDYDRFVNATNYRRPSDKGWGVKFWGRGDTPVFDVSWHDARQYAQWLSRQTGHTYRLPSEAEWEYAARAGTSTPFHTGDCINTDQANFHGRNAFGNCPVPELYRGKVVDVGSFHPNPWGLYDMHGNIFEWTLDCWHGNYQGAPDDGSAWLDEGPGANCARRVLRGGSWSSFVADIRSANRGNNDAEFKSIFIGFRLAREIR